MRPAGRSGAALAMAAVASVAVGLVAGCSGETQPTGLRLAVTYDETWALDRLELQLREQSTTTAVQPEILLLLPDDWAGSELTTEVWGVRGDVRLAHGLATAVLVRGETVGAAVVLERQVCGAWCTPGDVTCLGDGLVTCEERPEDGCAVWGLPTACPADAPHCSLGACAAACTDECVVGEVRCEGAGAVRTCGEADTDACAEWIPSVPCDDGEVCSSGECALTCRDECIAGAATCLGGARSLCGDPDGDGCTAWGPPISCEDGESCSSGECRSTCTDECSGSTCDGLDHVACGQFDTDPCRDRSGGVSCAATDGCLVGSCSPEGCATRPVVCDVPPSSCWASLGTCSDGACTYTPLDGGTCDDADACTTMDTCGGGNCVGTPRVCATPPAPFCEGRKKVHTFAATGTCSVGACRYTETVTDCADHCSAGACVAD